MKNSMVVFKFSVLGNLVPKNQNCQFKLKFGTKTSSNMQNLMMLFISSILYWKYNFGANLVQKIKIVTEAEICYLDSLEYKELNGSFFLISYRKYLFRGNFFHIFHFVCWIWNLGGRLIWICRIQYSMEILTFSFFRLEIGFLDEFDPKISKLSVEAEIWYLYYFEYVKLNNDVHFSTLNLFLQILSKNSILYFDITWLIS